MSYLSKMSVILSMLMLANYAQANFGYCGGGKITSIMEGAGNSDHLYLKVDNSVPGFTVAFPATLNDGWVVYESSLPSERLRAIRSLAMAAYFSQTTVWTATHNGRCDGASELGSSMP